MTASKIRTHFPAVPSDPVCSTITCSPSSDMGGFSRMNEVDDLLLCRVDKVSIVQAGTGDGACIDCQPTVPARICKMPFCMVEWHHGYHNYHRQSRKGCAAETGARGIAIAAWGFHRVRE